MAHGAPPLEDPGKRERAQTGIPVVPVFDGYRAWAIMGIVLLHLLYSSGVTAAAGGGAAGQLISGTLYHVVEVLFIVSGFVVFMPTAARGGEFGTVGAYAIRRATRLYPALWVSLLIVLALLAFYPGVSDPVPGIGEILINFAGMGTATTMVDPDLGYGLGVNGAIWTITPELMFYAVLPLFASVYARHPLAGLGVAAAVAIGFRVLFDNLGDVASSLGVDLSPQRELELYYSHFQQLPQLAFSFAAGMTGAWAYLRLRERGDAERLRRRATMAAGVGLLAVAVCAYLSGRYVRDTHFLVAPVESNQDWPLALSYTASMTLVMVALAFASPRLQAPFAHPLVRKLADISYGVFLIHVVIIWYLLGRLQIAEDGSLGSFATLAALVVPLSLLYGYLSARFLEQPIRRWAHRFGRRAQAETGPSGGPEGTSRAAAAP